MAGWQWGFAIQALISQTADWRPTYQWLGPIGVAQKMTETFRPPLP